MTYASVLWPKSEGGGCECDEGLNGNETPGFNLESDCLRAQSPGAGVDWELCNDERLQCVCVCVCVNAVHIWWDPGGSSATWRWPLREKGGGRGHLLAGGGGKRVTAIHLSNRSHSRLHLPTPFGISPPQGTRWPSLSSSWPGLLSTVPAARWNCHRSPSTGGHPGALYYNAVYCGLCRRCGHFYSASLFLVLKWNKPLGLLCKPLL